MIYNYFQASTLLMVVDGTDEANEGEWVFTSTNEQPYLPFNSGENVGNTDENCLDFTSTSSLLDRPCNLILDSPVICEHECKLVYALISKLLACIGMGVASRKPGLGSSWKSSTLLVQNERIIRKITEYLSYISA